jgi:hypothetical protein
VLVPPQGFALKELHISEDEMQLRLRQLALLLPDIAAKISVMKPQARRPWGSQALHGQDVDVGRTCTNCA